MLSSCPPAALSTMKNAVPFWYQQKKLFQSNSIHPVGDLGNRRGTTLLFWLRKWQKSSLAADGQKSAACKLPGSCRAKTPWPMAVTSKWQKCCVHLQDARNRHSPITYVHERSKLSRTKVFAWRAPEVLNFTGKLTAAFTVLVSFAGSNLNFFGNYCDFTRILWDEVGMKSEHRLRGENRSSLLTKSSAKGDWKRLLNRSRE